MPAEAPASALPEGAFDGLAAFHAALRGALASAATEGWREIVFSDADFSTWPLGERSSIEALNAWSRSGRSFTLLAHRFETFERTHARFVGWRQMWSHIIDCRICTGHHAPAVPSGIWTPSWFLHRIDPERDRGVCSRDPVNRRRLREAIDECLRQGRPGFPASTLGL